MNPIVPWLHIASLMTFDVHIKTDKPNQGCVDTSDSTFSMFQFFLLAKPHYSPVKPPCKWHIFAVVVAAVAVAVAVAVVVVAVAEILIIIIHYYPLLSIIIHY